MKVVPVIIKDTSSGTYTGFVKQFPGVCAQADSIDNLIAKLDSYLKIWFDYSSKNSSLVPNGDNVFDF